MKQFEFNNSCIDLWHLHHKDTFRPEMDEEEWIDHLNGVGKIIDRLFGIVNVGAVSLQGINNYKAKMFKEGENLESIVENQKERIRFFMNNDFYRADIFALEMLVTSHEIACQGLGYNIYDELCRFSPEDLIRLNERLDESIDLGLCSIEHIKKVCGVKLLEEDLDDES